VCVRACVQSVIACARAQGNKNQTPNGLINFQKCRQEADVIREVMLYQQPYNLVPVASIQVSCAVCGCVASHRDTRVHRTISSHLRCATCRPTTSSSRSRWQSSRASRNEIPDLLRGFLDTRDLRHVSAHHRVSRCARLQRLWCDCVPSRCSCAHLGKYCVRASASTQITTFVRRARGHNLATQTSFRHSRCLGF
jgi:hypothetical protein